MTEPDDQPPYAELGRLVRFRREQVGLSNASLAKAVESSPSTIFRLEQGVTTNPRPALIANIARELQITADDIIEALPEGDGLGAEVAGRLGSVAVARIASRTHVPLSDGQHDIIAITPEGGVMFVTMKNTGDDDRDRLAAAITAAGFIVTTFERNG